MLINVKKKTRYKYFTNNNQNFLNAFIQNVRLNASLQEEYIVKIQKMDDTYVNLS